MKNLIIILVVIVISCSNVFAQTVSPADYFPLVIGNHWQYNHQWDLQNPLDDRWYFFDVVDTTYFGVPGELLSYRMERSVSYAGFDTTLRDVYYYTFNDNGDVCVSALIIEDNFYLFDSLWIYIKNPITVGDSLFFGDEVNGLSTTIKSISDTLNLPLGNFENCLHLRWYRYLNGQPIEEVDEYYIPNTYWPIAGIGKKAGIFWYQYPDSARYSLSTLIECTLQQPTSVEMDLSSKPYSFHLSQNYPNPFNPVTTIQYSLPKRVYVNIDVYNMQGQKIRTLMSEFKPEGVHQLIWDGLTNSGTMAASGIYIIQVIAGEFRDTKKAVFMK